MPIFLTPKWSRKSHSFNCVYTQAVFSSVSQRYMFQYAIIIIINVIKLSSCLVHVRPCVLCPVGLNFIYLQFPNVANTFICV